MCLKAIVVVLSLTVINFLDGKLKINALKKALKVLF
jgi:hypothetical protein